MTNEQLSEIQVGLRMIGIDIPDKVLVHKLYEICLLYKRKQGASNLRDVIEIISKVSKHHNVEPEFPEIKAREIEES